VDDPTRAEHNGQPLLGGIEVDIEGVPAKPVKLIEGGLLKDVLRTRQPIKGFTESNGRARIPGSFGHKRSGITNLIVQGNKDGVDASALKKRLIEMIQQRNKPYGIIVRKMDFPSSASFDEVRRLAAALPGAGGHIVSSPLLTYRIYPDGREELVRGVRFRSLGVRSLRDILAASKEQYAFDFVANAAPFSLIGAAPYVYLASCVAPSILFDDLEMERPQMEHPKPPLVPAPPLTR
jgi:predicted Zn-dependent protease